MAVYALLTAGENPKDPRIVKAVDLLKKTQTAGTYAIGFRANAYALMPVTDEMKRLLAADANWLKGAYRVGKDVKARGFYGYGGYSGDREMKKLTEETGGRMIDVGNRPEKLRDAHLPELKTEENSK